MTKEIQLTKGFVTLVDDEDYDWLNSYKWFFTVGYAARAYDEAAIGFFGEFSCTNASMGLL